jgi:O-antigen/teichoic acid export membrane protein
VSSLASPGLMYMDRFVLGAVVGVAAVGYYTPSFELAVRLSMVPAAIVATLFPAFSMLAAGADPARLERLVAQATKYVLLAMGPPAIALAAGAHDLLHLWLGADFAAQGTLALQVMLFGIVVNGLAFIPFTLIQAVGRPDVSARLQLIQLPLFALLAYVLVRAYGIPGAALAWSVRAAGDAALLFWAAGRLQRFSVASMVAGRVPQTALLLVLFAAAVAAVGAIEAGPWLRFTLLAAGLSAVAPLLWRFGLGAADRETIRGLLFAGSVAR